MPTAHVLIDPDQRPEADEFFEFYNTYVRAVPDGQCLRMLVSQIHELQELFSGVSDAEASVVHPPYTWTIKQVVGHLIDAERVFADRLHRFSSGETRPQPGMDQNPYVDNHDYEKPELAELVSELIHCREANLRLVRRIQPHAWNWRGIASDHPVSCRALLWILVGHIIHHMNIVRKRLRAAAREN